MDYRDRGMRVVTASTWTHDACPDLARGFASATCLTCRQVNVFEILSRTIVRCGQCGQIVDGPYPVGDDDTGWDPQKLDR
jgi:ribosomal protein S27E